MANVDPNQTNPLRRAIDLIVIHCSASPNGKPITVREIDAWHAARGFARNPAQIGFNQPALKSIGYHYVVYSGGPVVTGRGLNETGAHAQGYNTRSIGICLVGTDKFRLAQWNALRILVNATIGKLAMRARLPDAPRFMPASVADALALARQLKLRICGHRDLSPDRDGDGTVEPQEWLKTCPGFDVSTWLAGGMQPLMGHILDPEPSPAEAA